MQQDDRCYGTGTCIIDAQGRCWCGQHWDGEKMCFAKDARPTTSSTPAAHIVPPIPTDKSAA